MFPSNHVIFPLSNDSPLLVTISHVFLCLEPFHTSSAIFMAVNPIPLNTLRLSEDNFYRLFTIICTHLHSSAPIVSDSCLVVQLNYPCSSLKPISSIDNHPYLPIHRYHSSNFLQTLLLIHHQDFPLHLFVLIGIHTCYYFFHSKETLVPLPFDMQTSVPLYLSPSSRICLNAIFPIEAYPNHPS